MMGNVNGLSLDLLVHPGETIKEVLEEKKMSQKQLATEIGISPSRINDYITGRSEPTLKIARLLCKVLNITPAAMLQY